MWPKKCPGTSGTTRTSSPNEDTLTANYPFPLNSSTDMHIRLKVKGEGSRTARCSRGRTLFSTSCLVIARLLLAVLAIMGMFWFQKLVPLDRLSGINSLYLDL